MVCIESTAVCCCHRCGLPSEMLCADALVLTTPIMEPLGRRLAEYNVDKGQKVNAGQSNGW